MCEVRLTAGEENPVTNNRRERGGDTRDDRGAAHGGKWVRAHALSHKGPHTHAYTHTHTHTHTHTCTHMHQRTHLVSERERMSGQERKRGHFPFDCCDPTWKEGETVENAICVGRATWCGSALREYIVCAVSPGLRRLLSPLAALRPCRKWETLWMCVCVCVCACVEGRTHTHTHRN